MEIQSETIYFSKVMDPLRGNFMLLNLGRKIIKFAFQESFLKSNNTLKYGLPGLQRFILFTKGNLT